MGGIASAWICLIIFIVFKRSEYSLVLGSDTFEGLGLRHLLGRGVDEYFRGFDIFINGLEGMSRLAIEQDIGHKFSSIPNVAFTNSIPISTKAGDIFWENIRRSTEKNSSLVVLINLPDLKSLPTMLEHINIIYKNEAIYQKPYFFLVHSQIPTPPQILEIRTYTAYVKDLEIDSDVYLNYLQCTKVDPNLSKSNDLLEVAKFTCPSGTAEVKTMEFYSVKDDAFIEPVNLVDMQLEQKVIRRTDFRKSKLMSIAVYGYPFRAAFSKENNSFVSGYEVEQIKFLAESYNLSVVAGVGNGWINIQNETLTGMGAQVLNGEADISISASEVLTYRAGLLTFLHPTYYTKMWGFFVQPPSSSFRDIFIHAFTGDLWLTMFSTWILIVFAMAALAIVKRRLDTMHENDTVLIQELIIWAAGAICQQGWHICPESTSMKIVFIFALITGLVSYVAYSAALVSILSMKVVPVRHLNDLVNHRYTLYQDNQTINAKYVIQELESAGRIPCLPYDQRSIRSEPALSKILSSSAALIGVADLFYPTARMYMNDTNICNFISKISVSSRPIRGGMFIKKGSPLKDFLNHKVLLMYERGIRYRLLENYFRESSVMCLEKSGSTKDPLGFNDVYTAFVVLLLGYCLSFFIFVVENVFPPSHYKRDSWFVKAWLSRYGGGTAGGSGTSGSVKAILTKDRRISYDFYGNNVDKW